MVHGRIRTSNLANIILLATVTERNCIQVSTSVSTYFIFLSSFVCLLKPVYSRYKSLKLHRRQYLDYFRVFQLHSSTCRNTKNAHGFMFLNTSVDYNSSTMAMACLICHYERSIYRRIHFTSLAMPQTSSKAWACVDSLAVIGRICSGTMPLIIIISLYYTFYSLYPLK